jgi:flagellar motor switch/type III secretory pathway protein FliN
MTIVVRPPALPGIAAADTAWWNALLSHAGRPLPLSGKATLSFAHAAAPSPSTPAMEVESDAGLTLLVALKAFPFQALLGADLELADLDALPPDLAGALREGLVAYVGSLAPQGFLGALRMIRAGALAELQPAEGARALVWFDAAVEGLPGPPIAVAVGLARAALLAHCKGMGLANASVRRSLGAAISIDGAYTLGRLSLPGAKAAALAPGALAVLGSAGSLSLRLGERLIRLEPQGASCLCTGIEPLGVADPAADIVENLPMDAQGKDDLATPLAKAARLAVDFDLGSVSVTLAELESWAPGCLVPLQPPSTEDGVSVTIRHRGRAIGLGELVRIDDRIAVRITSMEA